MRNLAVNAEKPYQVKIGVDSTAEIKRITSQYNKILLVAPNKLLKKLKIKERKNIQFFGTPDGENQKSIATLERVWNKCAQTGIKRTDAVIGLGGGATTDLAGFVAATWLRGVDWYAIPTSLAGMVDASVGGKTGINAKSGKNLIGSFYSPSEVLIDTKFLSKLPRRDLSAGMAEVIKCGFIADYRILNLVQTHRLDYEDLIYRSVKVKVDIVSKDFKENKLREILNYGHTLGHAVEKDSRYKLRHGEAVSIGMVFAAELSKDLAGLSDEAVLLHRELLQSFQLPTSYLRKRWQSVQGLLAKDKKSKGANIRFIGISKIGKPVWLEDVSPVLVSKVYERISK